MYYAQTIVCDIYGSNHLLNSGIRNMLARIVCIVKLGLCSCSFVGDFDVVKLYHVPCS